MHTCTTYTGRAMSKHGPSPHMERHTNTHTVNLKKNPTQVHSHDTGWSEHLCEGGDRSAVVVDCCFGRQQIEVVLAQGQRPPHRPGGRRGAHALPGVQLCVLPTKTAQKCTL